MKEVVTEDNYKQVVLKRMITLCWVLLGICFVIKIFGGNFFAFVGKSAVVEYIAQHLWLFIIVQFIFYYFGTIILLSCLHKGKGFIINSVSTVLMFSAKLLAVLNLILTFVSFIIESIFLIVVPIILDRKYWFSPIVINILVIVFQLISMFIKDITFTTFPYAGIVGYIYMIDYYIMLVLMYLYYKKGDFKMTLGVWFLSKDITQLEAYKGILKDKYEKKVAKIDAKIEKINKKK